MNKSAALRALPSVHEIIAAPELSSIQNEVPISLFTQWVRTAVDQCREQILHSGSSDAADSEAKHTETTDEIRTIVLEHVRASHRRERGISIQPVINATGIVLHTNLGRAPLAEPAIKRVVGAAGYSNVELDLTNGKRSKRGQRVADLLCEVTKTEDAVIVNNCAAATMLVLQTFAQGFEVIISRGQLVEIGGGFRLPDVFRSAGVTLREVGTTNRSYLRDYESALSDVTGAVLRVHHSNFRMSGFVTEPNIDELVQLERPEHLPVIDDLGSGWLSDDESLIPSEPSVRESVAAGADMTLFSGDKLLGGPQCGIIIGKRRFISRLRSSPLMRALRVDKLTIAAMEATLEIHLSGEATKRIPALAMLAATAATIRERCLEVVALVALPQRDRIEIVTCQSEVGGGSVPGQELASYGLRVSTSHPNRLAQQLRDGSPAVQTRIHEDALLLDLRTVADHECRLLAKRLDEQLVANDGDAGEPRS